MRTALTVVAIVVVALIGVAIVCMVNAPKWMDGPTVAKPAAAPVATTRAK